MGVHSYPPEHRLHDVPVYRYSRNYRPRTTASYDYPSYDLPEDGGVYSYPPEYPEEEEAAHPAPEKHRSDGWSKTLSSPEGANSATQVTVNASATMQNTTVVGEPVQGSRHPSHALENASSHEPAVPPKHRNDGWSRPTSHSHTNVQQTVAIVLPQVLCFQQRAIQPTISEVCRLLSTTSPFFSPIESIIIYIQYTTWNGFL
ncbi:hypothetical protein OSTOST_02855 [Ostertagia ostertagi]